jgi:hypothetical protein
MDEGQTMFMTGLPGGSLGPHAIGKWHGMLFIFILTLLIAKISPRRHGDHGEE